MTAFLWPKRPWALLSNIFVGHVVGIALGMSPSVYFFSGTGEILRSRWPHDERSSKTFRHATHPLLKNLCFQRSILEPISASR